MKVLNAFTIKFADDFEDTLKNRFANGLTIREQKHALW